MTVVCPNGHSSETTDYCDQCGALIIAEPPVEVDNLDHEDTSPAVIREPCPRCHAPRSGDDRFCEACGHDFDAPPGSNSEWELVATADHEQFERCASSGLAFPADYVERRFTLEGTPIRIGRSRGADGVRPEIDLAGSPEDPGISRLHAVLERSDDGSYILRDLGSTNGTLLNDDPQPVDSQVGVPLSEGDRIRIGAWTTITIRSS
jgi:FHA domain